MKWRVIREQQGWVIEYKEGFFSRWTPVINFRHFSFEPGEVHYFPKREEANTELKKLVKKYGGIII